jgi:ribosomal protein S18 acetylase RimI-like enzyme
MPHARQDLIELSDLNYAEASRELARRAGGTVLDEDGLLLFAGTTSLPVLFNAAFPTDDRLGAEEVLARANRFFAARARGYTLLLRAHAPEQALRAAAESAGLTQFGDTPAMFLERRLDDARPGPGIELRRVESDADATAFGRVMGEAYATYGMPVECGPAAVGRLAVLRAPHIATFLALADGEPAAGAMVILSHGIGGIYWVGTLPAARGRGLAELCTRAAGNAGFDMGARVITLQASIMGDPIYRRMGYFEVTRYPYLVRFDPPAAS